MTSPRVLIVEDDPDHRRALAIRLRASGYEVATAADGLAAVSQARELRPDLILLDLGLPAGDGYSVMERLRLIAPGVPVVVLSARDAASESRRALAAGAVAFLAKPADATTLLATLAAHVPQAADASAAGARILVVEDDADLMRGLSVQLRAAGFEVDQAGDGAGATAAAVRTPPDLVLLDLGLPGGDGFAVLDRLGRHGTLAAIPVVVVSARDPALARPRALAAGAVDYLQKPVETPALLDAIRRALRPA